MVNDADSFLDIDENNINNTQEDISSLSDKNNDSNDEENVCVKLFSMIIRDFEEYPNFNYIDNFSRIEDFITYYYDKSKYIKIKYKFDKNMINNNMIEILGKVFVNNNKDNCFLLINDNFIELIRYINLEEVIDNFDISKFEEIEINIIERNNKKISNLSFMFYEISSSSISLDFSNFNMSNIKKLRYMFYKCSLMTDLPNILGWNSVNVTDMSYMFANCSSLKSFPDDISEWAMENVIDISYIFSNCGSLKNLADLSKWKTSKIVNMQYLFYNCSSLSSLPDISKRNIEKVSDISYIISGCTSLLKVPNISNWDISNLNNPRFLFYNCKDLIIIKKIYFQIIKILNYMNIFLNLKIQLMKLIIIIKKKKT